MRCQACHDLEHYHEFEMTSGQASQTGQGCSRCNLLNKSLSLLRNKWPHLDEANWFNPCNRFKNVPNVLLTADSGMTMTIWLGEWHCRGSYLMHGKDENYLEMTLSVLAEPVSGVRPWHKIPSCTPNNQASFKNLALGLILCSDQGVFLASRIRLVKKDRHTVDPCIKDLGPPANREIKEV